MVNSPGGGVESPALLTLSDVLPQDPHGDVTGPDYSTTCVPHHVD